MVFLIRHPIPTSLSREELPRLKAYVNSDYKRHFTQAQRAFAQNVIDNGSYMEKAMLSWCFQNAVPLRDASEDWAIVSYEQLVVDPQPVIDYLADRLELPEPERMLDAVGVPSATAVGSTRERQQLLVNAGGAGGRRSLIGDWRKRVDPEAEQRLMETLDVFGIDAYSSGEVVPSNRYWV